METYTSTQEPTVSSTGTPESTMYHGANIRPLPMMLLLILLLYLLHSPCPL